MTHPNTKPRFFRHFLRRLASCLVTAGLVGATFTGAVYFYRTRRLYQSHQAIRANLVHDLEKQPELSELALCGLLGQPMVRYDPENVDMAVVLTKRSTGETYTSAPLFRADTRSGEVYYSRSEALLECSTRMGSQSRALRLKDMYVQEGVDAFYPGVAELVDSAPAGGSEQVLETLDLTPADVTGLEHYRIGGTLAGFQQIGSAPDSLAMQALLPGSYQSGFWKMLPAPGEPFSVTVDDFVDGTPYSLQTAVVYHFWHEQYSSLLRAYAFLLLVSCAAAAVMAGISVPRARKIWEMDEYRRNLTNTLAHDLRSPLTAITGYAENLKRGVHREKQDYYMDAILRNTAYMDSMISDVLALSVLESTKLLQREPTDLMALFREAFTQYEPQMQEKSLTLHMEGACTVRADRRMLQQAVTNLVSNAVRCTPEGGEIRLTGLPERLTLANSCHAAGDASALTEPFAKLDAARSDHSGSGLGLTIVRQILELHGMGFSVALQDGWFTAELLIEEK